MTSLTCLRAGVWLQQLAAGLGEPERLRLEEHLSTCVSCRVDADRLRNLSALAAQVEPELTTAQREQVLQRALRGSRETPSAQSTSRGLRWLAPALSLAALALAFFTLHSGAFTPGYMASDEATASSGKSRGSAAISGDQSANRDTRVLTGQVSVDEPAGRARVLSAGASLPRGVVVAALTDAQLDTGRAHLSLRAGTRVAWQPDTATVHLETGELLAQVDKDRSREFHVSTRDFVVVVTGTRFAVTLEGVQVREGSVRIVARDGRVLAEDLRAGEAWQRTATDAAKASSPSLHNDAGVHGQVALLLDHARRSLGAGNASEARAPIAQALSFHPERRDRAEALSLRAETALVAAEYERAAQGYLDVAAHYADLPAGENALFAAARLQLAHATAAQARSLFVRYLERYPHGRFRSEAQARIAQLDAR